MVDSPDTPDPSVAAKRPARVTTVSEVRAAASAGSTRKAAAKKAPAKKAAPKKAAAKKPAPKKAAATKAAPRKAAPRKVAAKKAPAKKAPAKKAVAKKPAPKKAPTKKAAAKKAPATRAAAGTPTPTRRAGDDGPVLTLVPPVEITAATPTSGLARRSADPDGRIQSDRWAICVSITQELLNDVVLMVVGAGVPLEPLDTTIALPGLGDVDVRLALTITGGELDLRADDGGRARVIVRADGEVSTRSTNYDGDVLDAPAGGAVAGLPTPPAPIPVRVEALVDPFIELGEAGGSAGLDLRSAELVSLATDPDAPVPEDVDPATWAGILQMFGMVFSVLGGGLFESLGEHVGRAELELPDEVAELLQSLGVAAGPGDVTVASGLLTVGLPADASVSGRALPVPIAGKRVGLGVASSLVDAICQLLIERVAGDLPLPFEIDVDLGEQQVGGRLRQSRLFPESFPDLRTALRTEIRPRLLRGRLELSVQSAYLELPSALPSIFNHVSRRLGDLVSLAPMRVRLPSTIQLPIIPDSTDTVGVEIDDLSVTSDGIGVVVGLA